MVPIQRSCDVENLGDFCRYYSGAWVGWHGSDASDIQPCYVGQQHRGDSVHLSPLVKGPEGQFRVANAFYVPWPSLTEHLDFGVPDIGMMPDGPTMVFCSYSTPRTPRKGFRSGDTRVSDFNSWGIRNKYSSPKGGNRYDWTWFAFNPEYSSLEKAEDKLMKGDVVGVPLSRTLGVYSFPKSKHSLLAYKRWTVGHVVSPYLIQLMREFGDYEEDIARQTGAEVIVR